MLLASVSAPDRLFLLELFFDAALPAIEAAGLTDVTCTGGGRIRHDAGSKLFIYGYSLGFGRADHATTEALCRKAFPSYEISWSNDGY